MLPIDYQLHSIRYFGNCELKFAVMKIQETNLRLSSTISQDKINRLS